MIIQDQEFWDILTSTVMPIKSNRVKKETKKLKVNKLYPSVFPTVLDLHAKTIQSAYDSTVSFIEKHLELNTKYILIITGKGKNNNGLIRKEFDKWLETNKFKNCICDYEWVNGNGAIRLKMKSKKC